MNEKTERKITNVIKKNKNIYFLVQNMRWVEKLRHPNVAHIFNDGKLLSVPQGHGEYFVFPFSFL